MKVNEINITEVCPRDGFQNVEKFIETSTKIEVIEGLIESGFKKIQVTSFVNPVAVPQMRDAKSIVEYFLKKYPDVSFTALVPNIKGADLAIEAGIKEISFVVSASEKHNLENVRKTIDASFEELEQIRSDYPSLKIKVDIATAFGCPFLEEIPVEQVKDMIDRSLSIQVDEIFLADTIGVANPKQVGEILDILVEDYPDVEFGFHMHDTRGMGLANVFVILQKGYGKLESAAGGLGGCPFAPGAAGNIASEDLVNMLHSMDIDTGVNIETLLDTTDIIKKKIKNDLTSHLSNIKRVQR